MEQDFLTNLPLEITTDIISRLPIPCVAISKCVCKPWLNLLESDDFEIKTQPALALILHGYGLPGLTRYKIEYEDEADLESHNILKDFKTLYESSMKGVTAIGSLLLFVLIKEGFIAKKCLHICNPVTRKYVDLQLPKVDVCRSSYGIGLSKISGKYKVVCINPHEGSYLVYTLGTGKWRHLEDGALFGLEFQNFTAKSEINGNPHWILFDSNARIRICGFDVETECFSMFSPPPPPFVDGHSRPIGMLSALRNCICYSYTWDDEIVIWIMKKYQVEESWTIEYKLSNIHFDFDRTKIHYVSPIKIFKNGDILMLWNSNDLIYYSNKTQQVDMMKNIGLIKLTFAVIFTPSLLSLESFGFKTVLSF